MAEQNDGKFVQLEGLNSGAEVDDKTGCVYGYEVRYYSNYPKVEDTAKLWRILGKGDKAERRAFHLCGPEVKYGIGANQPTPIPTMAGGGHF